jgi:hypothetical protein
MRGLALVLIAGLASACARVEASRPTLQVHMKNVDLRVASDITLHIKQLSGQFVSTSSRVPYLDDKSSYTVVVDSGEVALDTSSLNALMARVLGNDHSNLRKVQLTLNQDGTLQQKGSIAASIHIPFSAKSQVSLTPDGRIRVTTTSMKGFGVPMKPVLSLFRIEMDDLVKVDPGRGVEVVDDDLILDPSRLLPSPGIKGRLSAVKVEGGLLVQTFGSGGAKPVAATPLSPNHIYWRGAQLSFGKLTMTDTDLELVDMDPNDPFDFSIDEWNAQLIAGYSKTLPTKGLRTYVPDYNDLANARAVKGRVTPRAKRGAF